MERVQSVKIKLSDGSIGTFWGSPITEHPPAADLTVVDVVFDAPRYVGGISFAQGTPVAAEEAP